MQNKEVKNSEKNIPILPSIISILVICASIYYISLPRETANEPASKSTISKYSNRDCIIKINRSPKKVQKETIANIDKQLKEKNLQDQKTEETSPPINTQNQNINNKSEADSYVLLLDELKKHPAKSISSAKIIISKMLEHKGYPANIFTIYVEDIQDNSVNTQGSYIAAYFNPFDGSIHLNKSALYKLNIYEMISVIAHELDHFEKISQVAKTMGINNFVQILNENKPGSANTDFWNKAIKYAKTDNFDSKKYEAAFKSYMSPQKQISYSMYSYLNNLSNHVRNQLEISAYDVSNNVLDHYGIKNTKSPLLKLAEQFNKIDWDIYNETKDKTIIKDKRIDIFDYLILKAIANQNANNKKYYEICIKENNSDMSSFYTSVLHKNYKYINNEQPINATDILQLYALLIQTEKELKTGISENVICEALKQKINTKLSKIDNAENIRNEIKLYLKYLKENKISLPQTELKYLLTLICIENNLYKNATEKINLYYLNMPKEFKELYEADAKKEKFKIIYDNSAFKQELATEREENSSTNNSNMLIKLLEEARLNKL